MSDAMAPKSKFGQAANVIGVVSGAFGILQGWRELGGSILNWLWNGLYFTGYIAPLAFTAYAVMAGVLGLQVDDAAAIRKNRVALVVALAIGAALGVWLANAHIETRRQEGNVPWGSSKALPENAMRVVGALCIVIPLAWRFLPAKKPESAATDPPEQD